MFDKSILELSTALKKKQISAFELANYFLDRVNKFSHLNAFLDVNPQITLEQAKKADKKLSMGESGILTGIPIAHKDIFVTRNFSPRPGRKC